MKKRSLPTGEEPPKGYESVVNLGIEDHRLFIDSVILSQIAHIEVAEIETLRTKALSTITMLSGLADDSLTFEREVNIIPDKSISEKLLFRAYLNKELVGYALVIIGWPNKSEWVIQHLLVNPDYRLQGIGSSIVAAIEEFAISSEVDATRIFAIPVEERGTSFWNNLGYSDVTHRTQIQIAGIDRELIIYRKRLEDASLPPA